MARGWAGQGLLIFVFFPICFACGRFCCVFVVALIGSVLDQLRIFARVSFVSCFLCLDVLILSCSCRIRSMPCNAGRLASIPDASDAPPPLPSVQLPQCPLLLALCGYIIGHVVGNFAACRHGRSGSSNSSSSSFAWVQLLVRCRRRGAASCAPRSVDCAVHTPL